ncbi:RNA polymerase factor sigma-54 [Amaricoccus solimangrovi]|uniref:RNA polymerase sigma-54 factor n=1 Tax=Amaricoccus solimangrovi TaxID=2589815 RepID=A0A501WV07_9RHOB|nr:RNA polymerase factor sigma-54 [Amaricoccus solimangrovi]TPE52572.1 RNA polymerase factor sigma-54 [Amaricoccus solimangrovi]
MLAPRIELRQKQSLALTPQLRQSIKLLGMSNLELGDYVAAAIERNPLLELAPPRERERGGPRMASGGGGVDPAILEGLAAGVTLADHLAEQIRAMRAPSAVIEAALILAEELEEDGYLRATPEELIARHRLRPSEIARGLALVRACDPAGVGARSLRECLALQLRERDRLDPAMEALLGNLGLAASGQRAELRRICGVDDEDLTEMLDEIRALDPKPGLRFSTPELQVAVPDVFVTAAPGGGWSVELNTDTLPRVLTNNQYSVDLGPKDAATRAFISECGANANWLVRSLEQRARTILRVATEIVALQGDFFTAGVSRMRPLTRRALADRLGLHESTVSRVTANKYIACAQGNLPMRFFFSSALEALGGGETFSAAAVRERIRQIIEAEPPARTLSDDRIVALLRAEGIDIARRTVAKYREGMGILSSVERRRRKSNLARV